MKMRQILDVEESELIIHRKKIVAEKDKVTKQL